MNKILKFFTNKIWGIKNPPSDFWMKFTRTVHQRGVVAYVENTHAVNTSAPGVEHAFNPATTEKIILLPGDDHSKINESNLIGYEPLNRYYRKQMEKERATLTTEYVKQTKAVKA